MINLQLSDIQLISTLYENDFLHREEIYMEQLGEFVAHEASVLFVNWDVPYMRLKESPHAQFK